MAGSFSALEFFDLFDFGRKNVKLCKGILDGAVRVFGDETIAIFGFDAGWEMDTLRGGGWMRLTGDGLIEGEFVGEGDLGSFTAKRCHLAPRNCSLTLKMLRFWRCLTPGAC